MGAFAFTSVAQAEPPKLISYGNFPTGTDPVGVAVDQPSNDVYVASFFESNINKFDASGKLLSPPSPFGEGYYTGTAVNPANGDVDVFNFISDTIQTYEPSTGAPAGTPFAVPVVGEIFERFSQIATDGAGDVYVPEPLRETSSGPVSNDEVQEYSPSGTLLNTFTGSGAGTLKEPTGVAVDSSGNLWIADKGNNRLEEISPADVPLAEIKSEGVQSVALDGHGDVFATAKNSADFCGSLETPCFHLVEYSPTGTQLADIGAGELGEAGGGRLASMVAVDDASGRVYVTDPAKKLVWIYGPPSAPTLAKELTAEVTTSEAKLGALIDPGGIETSYRFEYLSAAAYAADGESFAGPDAATSVPFPEGNVGQGISPRTVWATASGLAPGTTYHYRVIASNELGEVVGADQMFTTETSAQAACPNEQLRGGFSASLPDCRAYELVSPQTKTSSQPGYPEGHLGENHAASDGNRVAYTAQEPLPGSQSGGESYVSTRSTSGWATEEVIPRQSYTGVLCTTRPSTPAYSTDLSMGIVSLGQDGRADDNTEGSGQGGCNAEGIEVVSGEPVGFENLLLRDNVDGSYQLINAVPLGVTPADAHFQGASSDLSHVVFDEQARLTADAPAGVDDLYDWSDGVLRLVTVLPDGTPVAGSLAKGSNQLAEEGHPVSATGSRIFFTAAGDLYVRLNGSSTLQVDGSQAGGSGGGGRFQIASAEGSRVFFPAESRLTTDSTAQSGEPDLYECEIVEAKGAGARCNLSDLTVAKAGEHANVHGVAGASEDGSYVYFVADGVLASNENANKETATPGQSNLYVSHNGATMFIATGTGANYILAGGARVSPDGVFFAFASLTSLTGYDNVGTDGSAAEEIFLYSAASNQLACASCNPSGQAPTAFGAKMDALPGAIPHYLSNSGRLLFDSAEALVPLDTNGQTDVYEYEGGQLHLISSGTSSSESVLLDASESGDDVFFLTRQELVSQDSEEEARSIYDARVDGGFPAPSSSPPCTTADACRRPVSPQPSIYGAPSSQTFSGVGNLALPPPTVKTAVKSKKCKKGFVKKKGECVVRHVRKKNSRSKKAKK